MTAARFTPKPGDKVVEQRRRMQQNGRWSAWSPVRLAKKVEKLETRWDLEERVVTVPAKGGAS